MINFKFQRYFYDPYPHALFKNVFEKNFYENICNEFPSIENFESYDLDKQNNIKQKKFVLNDNHYLFKKILKSRKNLQNLYEYLINRDFREEILSLLENNYISITNLNKNKSFYRKMYEKIKNKKNFGFEFSMIPTNGGYIKPHTDGADKLVSFIIPIVKSEKFLEIQNSGTSILKTLENKYKYNYYNQTVPFESTVEVRQIPFEKNQMFLFVKTHNSLHSVGPMKNFTNEFFMRKSINFFLYK